LDNVWLGAEWFVDAHACDAGALRSQDVLSALFDRIVADLSLHPVGPAQWRVFPGAGGVTGLLLLEESHLACHTFPERAFAAFDLYCCRPRQPWPWVEELSGALGAGRVVVRYLARGEA
jgi:S-adenosylmethionine decarboxylase